MKDEEMAEEYADRTRIVDENTRAGTDCISLVQDYEGNYIDIHERIKQAFLAGLKAGRPQWHNVADELPISDKDKYYFVVDKLNVYMIARFYEGKWSNYSVIDDVIAWCEIPTFDKE